MDHPEPASRSITNNRPEPNVPRSTAIVAADRDVEASLRITERPPSPQQEVLGEDEPQPRGPWVRRWALRCVLALVVLFVGWRVWDDSRRWTPDSLNSSIKREVPRRTDQAQVMAWCNRHKISAGYTTDTTGDLYGDRTMPSLAGLDPDNLSGMVKAELGPDDVYLHWLLSGRITVYFFFDKEGKLVRHFIHPFLYEP